MFFSDRLSEFNIVQNDAFGASVLWFAVSEYFKATDKLSGMPMPMSMLILPVCYHSRSAQAISSCKISSGFYMAMARDRTIPAGLQERMEDMCDQSFAAISLAASAGLIEFDRREDAVNLLPKRKTSPSEFKYLQEDVKKIKEAARRLGRWFAETPTRTTCALLRVRF